MKKTLILLVAALALLAAAFFIGRWSKPDKPVPPPEVIVQIDTVTITEKEIVVQWRDRVRVDTAWFPLVDMDDDEPMDTIDYPYDNPPVDSVAVEIPIDRYIAQQDSLYRVVVDGYGVEFKEITVYPKTITITNTIETKKPTHWGIGVQAGYGVTLVDKTVKLSPYVGVGVSYNIITW